MMLLEKENIELQYQGYKLTSNLWLNDAVLGLRQFRLEVDLKETFKRELPKNLRLGKRVEQFVLNQLEQHKNTSILAENVQIQEQKQTIGELDAIISYHGKPIHLEIVYKFYVYDESVGTSELDHFIGPNRKDSLVEKLTKLKQKQLPLLYKSQTSELLNSLNLKVNEIVQNVSFKAQLFLPYNKQINLKTVNPDCVVGYFLKLKDVLTFEESKFYFPSKPNWLVQPNNAVNWRTYQDVEPVIKQIQTEKQSACCWIKQADTRIKKYFIVWW